MRYLAVLLLCASCAAPQANRFVDDYADARADGVFDASEVARLDRDATELDDTLRAPPIPTTGFPWIDVVAPLVAAAAAGFGSHKYTMTVRDRLAQAKAPATTPIA
jgi:isocitrate lyase